MKSIRFLKAVIVLFVGVSALVVAVSGHALEATYQGWTVVPVSGLPRLMGGIMGVVLTSLGAILVYKRQ